MRQLINQNDGGLPRDDSVQIHLFKRDIAILDTSKGTVSRSPINASVSALPCGSINR